MLIIYKCSKKSGISKFGRKGWKKSKKKGREGNKNQPPKYNNGCGINIKSASIIYPSNING